MLFFINFGSIQNVLLVEFMAFFGFNLEYDF